MNSPKVFTIFVDGLPHNMNSNWLKNIFKSHGKIVDVFISFKKRKFSENLFGFVRFQDKEDAKRAIEHFHGRNYNSFNLRVTWAGVRRPGLGDSSADKNMQIASVSQSFGTISRELKEYFDNRLKMLEISLMSRMEDLLAGQRTKIMKNSNVFEATPDAIDFHKSRDETPTDQVFDKVADEVLEMAANSIIERLADEVIEDNPAAGFNGDADRVDGDADATGVIKHAHVVNKGDRLEEVSKKNERATIVGLELEEDGHTNDNGGLFVEVNEDGDDGRLKKLAAANIKQHKAVVFAGNNEEVVDNVACHEVDGENDDVLVVTVEDSSFKIVNGDVNDVGNGNNFKIVNGDVNDVGNGNKVVGPHAQSIIKTITEDKVALTIANSTANTQNNSGRYHSDVSQAQCQNRVLHKRIANLNPLFKHLGRVS